MKSATCRNFAGLAWCIISALFLDCAARADTIRALSWNMASSAADLAANVSNAWRQAAPAFEAVEPQIILLQHVKDWQTCDRLAKALKPAGCRVVICSSFREGESGPLSSDQVAILSWVPAYFSWYESWAPVSDSQVAGGFAFAAVQFGKQRFGFYAAQFGSAGAVLLEGCARQILKHAEGVDNWAKHRIEGSLISASFETPGVDFFSRRVLKMLADAGYLDVLAAMPEAQRNAFSPGAGAGPGISDFLLAEPGACSGNPRILAAANFSKYPLLCDLDLSPALLARAARAKPLVTIPALTVSPAPQPPVPKLEEQPASSTGSLTRAGQPAEAVQVTQQPPLSDTQAVAKTKPAGKSTMAYVWISGTTACLFAAIIFGAMLARRTMMKRFSGALTVVDAGASRYVVVMPRSVSGAAGQPLAIPPEPRRRVEFASAHQTGSRAQREFAVTESQRTSGLFQASLLAQFRQWLKDRLVRKLLSDRADLMQTQELAALRALAVHERLSHVEHQMQQQNESYQKRIAELNAELLVAREENRQLISERIRQIKAEMEAARMKALAEARGAGEIG
jgi:hypothetical protein